MEMEWVETKANEYEQGIPLRRPSSQLGKVEDSRKPTTVPHAFPGHVHGSSLQPHLEPCLNWGVRGESRCPTPELRGDETEKRSGGRRASGIGVRVKAGVSGVPPRRACHSGAPGPWPETRRNTPIRAPASLKPMGESHA